MIALSIAITTSSLFISMAAIYAVYTWAEIRTKELARYNGWSLSTSQGESEDDNDQRGA